jgi:hypothetical protein
LNKIEFGLIYLTMKVLLQALVGYVTGATNNFDNGYDGET